MMEKNEFRFRSRRYAEQTMHLSFLAHKHPDFIAIEAAGNEIIPWLLEGVRDGAPCAWMCIALLAQKTGERPWDPKDAGRFGKIRDAWVKWGIEHGMLQTAEPQPKSKAEVERDNDTEFQKIPYEYRYAHLMSSYHRELLPQTPLAGCFYCLETFPPEQVEEWVDRGQTALCPRCGIDSVLPGNEKHLTPEFLKEMRKWWFES